MEKVSIRGSCHRNEVRFIMCCLSVCMFSSCLCGFPPTVQRNTGHENSWLKLTVGVNVFVFLSACVCVGAVQSVPHYSPCVLQWAALLRTRISNFKIGGKMDLHIVNLWQVCFTAKTVSWSGGGNAARGESGSSCWFCTIFYGCCGVRPALTWSFVPCADLLLIGCLPSFQPVIGCRALHSN